MYGDLSRAAYDGSAFTNATFSGSSNGGGVALSMQGGSLSSSTRVSSSRPITNIQYPIANRQFLISNSPLPISNLQSPIANGPSPIAYMTSDAEYRSFGGGGNGGAAMGGAMRGSSSPNSLIASSPITSISSSIAYSTARRSDMTTAAGDNPAQMVAENLVMAMTNAASAGNGFYGGYSAMDYSGSANYGQYTGMFGGDSRMGVRGRQNANGSHDNSWRMWLLYTWLPTMTDGWGTQGSDGNWYITEEDLRNAYNAFIAEWNKTMGGGENGGPTWDEWLAWFDPYGSGSGLSLGGNTYFWMPVGDILPLLLLALMYIFAMYLRSKSRTQVND